MTQTDSLKVIIDRSRKIDLSKLFTVPEIGSDFQLLYQNPIAARISSFDLVTDVAFQRISQDTYDLVSSEKKIEEIAREGWVPLDIHHMRAIAEDARVQKYLIDRWHRDFFSIGSPSLKSIGFFGTVLVASVNGRAIPHSLSFDTNDGEHGASADRIKEVLCYEATDQGWGGNDWFLVFRTEFLSKHKFV